LGSLVTKLGGAERVIPWFVSPLAVSMALLVVFDAPIIIWFYMITNGLSGGMFGVVQSVLWADLYGTKHLGAIRSLITSTSIFAAALAPAIMGWLLDAGWTMRMLAGASLAYILISMVVAKRVNFHPALSDTAQ
jgi:MFS family permease